MGRLRNGAPETQVVFPRPSRPHCRQRLPAQPSPPHPVSLGLPDRSDGPSAARPICAETCSCTLLLGGWPLAGPWRQRQSEGRAGGTPWPGLVRGLEQPQASGGDQSPSPHHTTELPVGSGLLPHPVHLPRPLRGPLRAGPVSPLDPNPLLLRNRPTTGGEGAVHSASSALLFLPEQGARPGPEAGQRVWSGASCWGQLA